MDVKEMLTSIPVKEEKDVIRLIEEAVNKLFAYQDRYFDNHKLEEATFKAARVHDKLEKTLCLLEKLRPEALQVNRAQYYYHYGRAFNVLPAYSPQAEEALAKAVKLCPQFVPAWNELGECYWKNDNMSEAKNCFEKGLSQKVNKTSLRNLSMLVRQEPCGSNEQKVANVEKGVELARQAVQMDTSDGLSWTVLGNAYLAAFFAVQQYPKTLKQAMSAYSQAALKYEEEYEEALLAFSYAMERDPLWESPRIKQNGLIGYLDNICVMILSKGRLKPKKIAALIQSIDKKKLGPYEGGQYTTTSGQSCKLEHVELSKLREGINSEKVVLGKVVCSIRGDDDIPFTFCLIDKESTVMAVTVYNLAQGKGVIIGDSVAIPEPFLTNINFEFSSKSFMFKSLRVDNPLVLVVNGKKVGRDKLAMTRMNTFKLPH